MATAPATCGPPDGSPNASAPNAAPIIVSRLSNAPGRRLGVRGGPALLVKDGKLWYVYNFTGILPNALFSARSVMCGRQVAARAPPGQVPEAM